jgi:hypothetical protein
MTQRDWACSCYLPGGGWYATTRPVAPGIPRPRSSFLPSKSHTGGRCEGFPAGHRWMVIISHPYLYSLQALLRRRSVVPRSVRRGCDLTVGKKNQEYVEEVKGTGTTNSGNTPRLSMSAVGHHSGQKCSCSGREATATWHRNSGWRTRLRL